MIAIHVQQIVWVDLSFYLGVFFYIKGAKSLETFGGGGLIFFVKIHVGEKMYGNMCCGV